MNFIHPAAFWLLLLLPLLAIPYFFAKKKTRESVVPHLALWEEVFVRTKSGVRNFGVRRILSFLLIVLIAVLLTTAVSYPVFNKLRSGAMIVIVDNSASMNAVEKNGATRLEAAKAGLMRIIAQKPEDQEIMIMTAETAPEIVVGFTKNEITLRGAAADICPTDHASSIKNSLEFAGIIQQSRPDAIIHLITDGCCEKEDALEKELSRREDIFWTKVGSEQDNLAFTQFQARRMKNGTNDYELFLDVANYSQKDVSFDIELDLDGAIIDVLSFNLTPGERKNHLSRYASEEGGVVCGRIVNIKNADDSLAGDSVAWSVLPKMPRLDILYYGEEQRYLMNVLKAQKNADFTRIEAIPDSLSERALLVVYRKIPEKLPSGNILLVSPQNDTTLFAVGDKVDAALLENIAPDQPMMNSIHLDHLTLDGVRQIAFRGDCWSNVLIQTPQTPVLFSVRPNDNPHQEWLVMNLSVEDGVFPLRTIFPILFVNVVESFRSDMNISDDESGAYNMRERISFKSQKDGSKLHATDSEGKEIKQAAQNNNTILYFPDRTGVFSIVNEQNEMVRLIAVNSGHAAESNLLTGELPRLLSPSELPMNGTARCPLWTMLAAAALMLLILEWHFYHRRLTE